MRGLVVGLVIALGACSSEDPDPVCPDPIAASELEAEQLVAEISAAAGVPYQLEQRIELAWSDGAVVGVSPLRCAEDLELCGFAVWHEVGHVELGDNEHLADCFAADRATPEQIGRAVCYFASTSIAGGADAAHGSGESRAARIEGCR